MVCGEWKANERFSGKGHARHICKDCARLSPEQRERLMVIEALRDASLPVSDADRAFLDSLASDARSRARKKKKRRRKRSAGERREARRKAARQHEEVAEHDELWVDDVFDLPF